MYVQIYYSFVGNACTILVSKKQEKRNNHIIFINTITDKETKWGEAVSWFSVYTKVKYLHNNNQYTYFHTLIYKSTYIWYIYRYPYITFI